HGAAAVAGDRSDAATAAGAAVAGMVRAAQAEHPGRFVLVDLDPGGPDADDHDDDPGAVDALVTAAVATGEPEVAVRNGRLHARRLVEAPPPAGAAEHAAGWGDGTVLVTGGTGTLGAAVARHLVAAHGVRSLLLAGRRGPAAPGAAELVAELEAQGAAVTVAAADVADRAAVERLLAAVPTDRPLRGVVHAAGTLDDAVLASLSPAQLAAVWGAKALGTWHLHELTRDVELAAFVVFTSTAGVLGAAGQANYAAASAFADAVVEHRRSLGLPGVAVAWGLWAEASGLTGAMADADRARMRRAGIVPLATADALRLLDRALGLGPVTVALGLDRAAVQASSPAGVPPVWRRLVAPAPPPTATTAAPASSGGDGDAGAPDPTADPPLVRRLAAAGGAGVRRHRVMVDAVRAEAATVLGHAGPDAVDPGRAFKDMGFDSLTAVDLRNRLAAATGLRLPTTLAFDHPTVERLAAHLATRLAAHPRLAEARAGNGAGGADPDGRLDADELVTRLEAAVAAGGVTPEVVDRLRRLASDLALTPKSGGTGDGDGGDGAADPAREIEDELADADAQEVLDFIDREFGEAVG
ncbi:MAG TPA: beta-ketoacyl reductase, partial [Acidimicrobiales bacterium]